MKTREEIRATTTGKIPRPANYKYGEKLKEWDDSPTQGAPPDLLLRLNPLHDRIIVRLIPEPPKGSIVLTDAKPLIGGDCRKALVLKCGPGKWMPGEWWFIRRPQLEINRHLVPLERDGDWEWFPGYRRPVAVNPGQTVYIGNWVDLEANGLALCQEGDVRGYV